MPQHKLIAATAYLIFFLPLLTASRHDPYIQYHVRQGIGLFIVFFALSGVFPNIWIFTPLGIFNALLWLYRAFIAVMVLLGLANALRGKMQPLPWFGQYAAKL